MILVLRPGVRLGIDLGTKRIGVARCDSNALLCFPVETVYRANGQEIFDIIDIAKEYQAFEIIVGLPRLLSGKEGKNAKDVRKWCRNLTKSLPSCNIRLVDERLTSVSAHNQLSACGMSGISQREVVDQQAAVLILEHALEIETKTGSPAGVLVPAN